MGIVSLRWDDDRGWPMIDRLRRGVAKAEGDLNPTVESWNGGAGLPLLRKS